MAEMDSFEWMQAEGFFEDPGIANSVKRMRPDLKRVEGLRNRAAELGLNPESPVTVEFFLEAMDTYVQFLISHRYVMKALLERTIREDTGVDRE
ncbi:MAG: hypothetical protein HY319_05245 [Armatimonadetes bacterium]|nr:hypothetical protein [Armatimonadota bacterium]